VPGEFDPKVLRHLAHEAQHALPRIRAGGGSLS
jgi:hypothetical protein